VKLIVTVKLSIDGLGGGGNLHGYA
jgi:hypothetical protein